MTKTLHFFGVIAFTSIILLCYAIFKPINANAQVSGTPWIDYPPPICNEYSDFDSDLYSDGTNWLRYYDDTPTLINHNNSTTYVTSGSGSDYNVAATPVPASWGAMAYHSWISVAVPNTTVGNNQKTPYNTSFFYSYNPVSLNTPSIYAQRFVNGVVEGQKLNMIKLDRLGTTTNYSPTWENALSPRPNLINGGILYPEDNDDYGNTFRAGALWRTALQRAEIRHDGNWDFPPQACILAAQNVEFSEEFLFEFEQAYGFDIRDRLRSGIGDYDLSELEDVCKTISFLDNPVTWTVCTVRMLFVPNGDVISARFNEGVTDFTDWSGVLGYPIVFVADMTTAISNPVQNPAPVLSDNFMGSEVKLPLNTIENSNSTAWSIFQNLFRAFIIFGLIFIIYRKFKETIEHK